MAFPKHASIAFLLFALPEIEYCQQNNIKVMLSIGQDITTRNHHSKSNTPSEDAAKNLTDYLLENFLTGQPGPLGNVSLDGIDLADVADGENPKWPEVVRAINNASLTVRKIYLSASPECVYPD
ncbi:Hevamine-A protein [Spatholobus suberectus]|nr:Hevamine-A protein [Spatholobus suberectus]